jgi:cytochrome c553
MRIFTLVMLALALAACDSSHADTHVPAYHEAMVRSHMREHYDMFGAIQHLVIRNDLYDVRTIARSIGAAPEEPGLDRWASQSALVRARADELAAAPGNDEACRRAARLAEACARCHVDAHVVPMFGSPPPLPATGTDVRALMARHVWATERLSEGMIGAMNDSWLAGLEVLANTPAPWSEMDADRAALSRRMQTIAEQTRRQVAKNDLAAQARAYGEILVTCAACHAGDRATAK